MKYMIIIIIITIINNKYYYHYHNDNNDNLAKYSHFPLGFSFLKTKVIYFFSPEGFLQSLSTRSYSLQSEYTKLDVP